MDWGSCKICNAPAYGPLCTECNVALGIVTQRGLDRPNKPCHRCDGTQFIRAQAREFTRRPGEHGAQVSYPMGVTYSVDVATALFSDRVTGVRAASASAPFGILDMYVCRACGLTEWYCRDPQNVPIAPELATEIVNVDPPGGPYR